jgi:hypothetical protein
VEFASIFTMGSSESGTTAQPKTIVQPQVTTPKDPCDDEDSPKYESFDNALNAAREQSGLTPDELIPKLGPWLLRSLWMVGVGGGSTTDT